MAGYVDTIDTGDCYPCLRTNLLPISPTAHIVFDCMQNPSWSYTLFNLAGAPFASNGCLNVNALGVEPFTCR